jgi:hypothetical protein
MGHFIVSCAVSFNGLLIDILSGITVKESPQSIINELK